MSSDSVVVVTPIYKQKLTGNEEIAMRHSFNVLSSHDLWFICPEGMDTLFYQYAFPHVKYVFFPGEFFHSPSTYNKLMMSELFYEYFSNYAYMLVLQTDAIVLRDELAYWVKKPYDYVGAPWGEDYSVKIPEIESPFSEEAFLVRVGNGGLSLRKIRSCADVLRELSAIVDRIFYYQDMLVEEKYFVNEDVFFSLAGQMSCNFFVPNRICASHFSFEYDPRKWLRLIGRLPMGAHAWERSDKKFWLEVFAGMGINGVV